MVSLLRQDNRESGLVLGLTFPSPGLTTVGSFKSKQIQTPSGSDSVWKRYWPKVQEIIFISLPLLNFLCSANAEDLFNSLQLGTAKSLCPGCQPASPLLSVSLPILVSIPPLLLPSRFTCKCFISERRMSKDGTDHLFVYFESYLWGLFPWSRWGKKWWMSWEFTEILAKKIEIHYIFSYLVLHICFI